MTVNAIQETDLAGLRAQNHAAFANLVACYHSQFKTVARSIVGDSIAEEVAQEAWVSIFNALPGFEGRSSLKTWLYTIVGNHAKTRLRKESRMRPIEEVGKAASGYLSDEPFNQSGHWDNTPALWEMESPDALLEEKQLRHCIEHTLSILPQVQRAAFTLRDIEQQSLEDICNILNVTNSNVRVLLHRARITLMEVIDHYQETGEC